MKKLNQVLVLLIVLSIQFLACSNSENVTPEVEENKEIQVDKTQLNFVAEGETKILSITSNTIWNIEYDASLWARPSLQTAKGNATVSISVDENTSKEARSMTFELQVKELDPITIAIQQEGAEEDKNDGGVDLPDYIDPDNTDMRSITALEIAKDMGLGWNLGNSLEAILSNNGELYGSETSWGNPVVTKQLIDSVKSAGFNTVRIPVSWSHQLVNADSFKISEEWKSRVEEVVNYALENEMYVLLNIHWDGGWMNHPFYENQEAINERLSIMWKQIAVYFRDYDDHLLFAGTNEVHVEGNFDDPTTENSEVQNSLNQTFVNVVRATGGRNHYRHLIVQTYNTNIAYGVNYFTFPEDKIEDRLMVEVHFYDPYQFTLEENGNTYLWGQANEGNSAHSGWGDESWVDEAFLSAKTAFIDKGYPVIMGEYGAMLKTDLPDEALELHRASRNYYLNYVTSQALKEGIVPVYWDNGHTGNFGFGLFERATGVSAHADALEAIISANE